MFKPLNGMWAPKIVNTVSYPLSNNWFGSLSYSTNTEFTRTFMKASLVYATAPPSDDNANTTSLSARLAAGLTVALTVKLSARASFAEANVSKTLHDRTRVYCFARYGVLGATLSYGVEKPLDTTTRLDASLIINSLSGIHIHLQ